MAILTYVQLKEKCLALTSLFETSTSAPNCFGVTAGNFDGAGMSFGAIQWNFGQGTLQPLFNTMRINHEAVFKDAFNFDSDPSYYNTLTTVLTTYTLSQQIAWADSISSPSNKHNLLEPWKTYFRNLGITDEMIAIELNAAESYFTIALNLFNEYKVLSPAPNMFSKRAYALFFDIAVQNGGISASTKSLIQSDFNAISTAGKTAAQIETEKMVIIANRRADASSAAFREVVRERKLAIANGSGYVYSGTLYVDTNAYDLNMEEAFATIGYFQNYNSTERPFQTNGLDIYHGQLDYPHNFASAYAGGARFVIFKVGGTVATNFSARYIRCWVNGSYTNTSSIFTEVQVFNSAGTNLSSGKTVTGSAATPQYGSYSLITDGNLSNYCIVGDNSQWVRIDLGSVLTCRSVKVWHYPNRKFKNNKVEYSQDGVTWTTLFDSAVNGEYTEITHPQAGTFLGTDFIKGTDAVYSRDTTFSAANIASARAAGLKIGCYFFKNPNYCHNGRFYTTTADASSDASVFWQYITSGLGLSDWADTTVWLDWENNDGNLIYPSVTNDGSYAYVKAFTETVRALGYKASGTGRQCGFYTAWFCLDGQTAATANTFVHSTAGGIASICPLWYSQIVDTPYGSAYPNRYGWNQGTWGGYTEWTLWQYSYQNQNTQAGQPSALTYGFQTPDPNVDCDIVEGGLYNILPPTPVSGLSAAGGSTSIKVTWTTGEADVLGYMLKISGQATATVGTGIGSATFNNLAAGSTYIISAYAYDQWETSTGATLVTAQTQGDTIGFRTLPCFFLPS